MPIRPEDLCNAHKVAPDEIHSPCKLVVTTVETGETIRCGRTEHGMPCAANMAEPARREGKATIHYPDSSS